MSALFDKIRHTFSRQGVQELINNTEIGDVYNFLTKNSSNSSASGGGVTSFNSNLNHQLSTSDGELDLFPDMESSGLWEMFFAFSTSKYCLFLIIVAFITNRIRHICRPNGRPRPIPRLTRLTILLPSLVSLSYIAFCFLKETTLAYSLESENGGQKKLKDLKVGDGDGTLFWRALLSSGVSIITENLLRNLEASHTEPSSFNLFSWALLLHQCLSFGPTPSSSPPSQPSSLKSTSLRTSLLARISSSAVRNRSNPFPNYSNTTFLTSRTHLFFHLSIIVSEILVLNVLDIFSKRSSKLRLPISSAFAFIGISQYVWNLSRNQRFSFDWSISRFWELVVLALIVLTAGLNLLTQLILTSISAEGSNSRHIRNFSPSPLNRFFQLDFSRIFFHPSNFPSLHDDFGTALFKLGASCLKTTRMNGMQVETIEIRTLETSYVEVNWKDGVGDQAQVKGVNQNENGLNNEIKRIQGDGFHNPRKEEEESPWLWETSVFQTLHTSVNRVRAIKDFLTEFYLLVRSFTVFVYQSFMNLNSVRRFLSSDQVYRIRRISNKVFKWCRLLWHGTKGERERELRIKTQEMLRLKEEREQKQLKEMIERRRKAREGILNSNASGYNSIHAINDDDEEEDDDWEERDSDEEIEGEGDEEEVAKRNRERLFSPTPGPEDFEDEPDSNFLIQLARSDFNSRDAVGTGNAWSRAQGQEVRNRWNGNLGSSNPMQSHNQNYQDLNSNNFSNNDNNNFSDIFLAHFSNSNNSPMTRRSYQSRFNQGLNPSSSSASSQPAPIPSSFVNPASDSSRGGALNQQLTDRNRRMMEEEQRKDLIDVMRARRIPINGNSNASGSLDYEKERLRTCVVCITEERTILLWPCRCLALCEGCRDSLASRPGSNSLTGGSIICPCCRSPIQGYSRLFLP